MLHIKNESYFERVCRFAAAKSPVHVGDFWKQLWYLNTYGAGNKFGDLPMLDYGSYTEIPPAWPAGADGFVVELSKDFAPASFGFTITKSGDMWFVGGLIYHGDQKGWREDAAYEDPLSVVIGEPVLWSIHT